MRTKDGLAFWILLILVLALFGRSFVAFDDALRSHRPISTILWNFGVSLIVAASGLFLICHVVSLTNDLAYYEGQEKQRENERRQKPPSM
jgi:hypothetical protein